MSVRTYQAYSINEVLDRIKEDLGPAAVILNTRTFKRGGVMGVGARTVYEVTASPGKATPTPTPSKRSSRSTTSNGNGNGHSAPKAEPTKRPGDDLNSLLSGIPKKTEEAPAPRPTPRPVRNGHDGTYEKPKPRPAEAREAYPVARRFILDPETGRARPAPAAPEAVEQRGERIFVPEKVVEPKVAEPQRETRSEVDASVREELAALRRLVTQALDRQTASLQPAVPERLTAMYTELIQNEVAQEIAEQICTSVRDELGDEGLADTQAVREAVVSRLSALIPQVEETGRAERSADGRPHTIALIGPTGVGKTTTVAKLAAAFKLREGKRVGLITTDTYRIAAVDQLRTYANIIGIPLKVALTPEEMKTACRDLRECDVVLIDTTGRSPNDSERIEDLRAFMDVARPHEVHLVLAGTSSQSVMLRTAERFSAIETDRVIFTKLDEAVSFGTLFNVMRAIGKRLSYVTTGQEVPDDIRTGQARVLAQRILGEAVAI